MVYSGFLDKNSCLLWLEMMLQPYQNTKVVLENQNSELKEAKMMLRRAKGNCRVA